MSKTDKKWKKRPKRTRDEKLQDELVDSEGIDIRRLAKKYEKSTEELVELCNTLGIY